MEEQLVSKNKREIEAVNEEILLSTIFDRTEDIQENGENVLQVFETNLKNCIFYYFPLNPTYSKSLFSVREQIQKSLKKGTLYYSEDATLTICNFMRDELDEITDDLLDNCNSSKVHTYLKFLATNFDRYYIADRLMAQTCEFNSSDYPSLTAFVKGKINPGEIDINEIDNSQKELLWYLDRAYLLDLLQHKDNFDSGVLLKAENKFNFEFYRNPAIYSEFPKEKLKYLKALKSWFLAQISQRKVEFGLEDLPYYYQYLFDYANSLVPKPEKISRKNTASFIVPIEKVADQDYPKFIFRDYLSYVLFKTIASQCQTYPQLSFLFRQMSEKEDPPLIVVNDTRFRQWFNSWNENFKLNDYTKTYLNSKKKERIDLYEIVKSLIFSTHKKK